MNSLAVSLLSFVLLAAKVISLTGLVLAGIGIYALYRMTIWCVGGLFGRKSCRRASPIRPVRAAPFAARYHRTPPPPPRPQPQPRAVPAAAARVAPVNSESGYRKSKATPSWSQLGIALVFFGIVALCFRAKELVVTEAKPVLNQRPPAPVKTVKGRPAAPVPVPVPAVEIHNPTPIVPDASWTGHGVGITLESARQSALIDAYHQFLEYLKDQNPPIEWSPASPDFVLQHLKTEWKEEKIREDDEIAKLRKLPTTYETTLAVAVLPKHREAILKLDQRYHSEQRMLWLGQVLGCVIALLAGIAGYVRLDEWTKGYYSGWLRLLAVGFVGAAGAGLWFLLGR
jgi:hypothetical protein